MVKFCFLTEKQIVEVSLLPTFELNNLPLKNKKQTRKALFSMSSSMIPNVLLNLYNPNTEREQIEVLSHLSALLRTFDINPNKHLNMIEVFNLLNSTFDTAVGNPTLK